MCVCVKGVGNNQSPSPPPPPTTPADCPLPTLAIIAPTQYGPNTVPTPNAPAPSTPAPPSPVPRCTRLCRSLGRIRPPGERRPGPYCTTGCRRRRSSKSCTTNGGDKRCGTFAAPCVTCVRKCVCVGGGWGGGRQRGGADDSRERGTGVQFARVLLLLMGPNLSLPLPWSSHPNAAYHSRLPAFSSDSYTLGFPHTIPYHLLRSCRQPTTSRCSRLRLPV